MEELKPTFAEAFRKVIVMIDPQANSLMSKDNPPPVKILADWGRKACDELEKSPFIKITPPTKMPKKDTGEFFNVIVDGDVEVCFYDGDWDCPNIGYLKNVTHYHKINLPEEN